ncbi:MAG: hypothetical protein AB7F64_05340, partial [Gammaproteobacteria bacterium]
MKFLICADLLIPVEHNFQRRFKGREDLNTIRDEDLAKRCGTQGQPVATQEDVWQAVLNYSRTHTREDDGLQSLQDWKSLIKNLQAEGHEVHFVSNSNDYSYVIPRYLEHVVGLSPEQVKNIQYRLLYGTTQASEMIKHAGGASDSKN